LEPRVQDDRGRQAGGAAPARGRRERAAPVRLRPLRRRAHLRRLRQPLAVGVSPRRRGILERLRDGVVLGDGGYILELERRGYVQAGPYTPEIAIEHPDALRELHREFLRAGADVL